MSAFPISSNVPLPADRGFPGTAFYELRQVLKRMKVGQSIVVKDNKLVFRAAEKTGVPITTRKENGSGYRVWRVK